MRDLTKDFDMAKYEFSDGDLCGVTWVDVQDALRIDFGAKPAPIKSFDIEKYVFSDVSLTVNPYNNSDDGYISLKIGFEGFSLNKQDVISMAKALGVTAEDLK